MLGLIFTTGIAVLGGKILAKYTSERFLNIGGGILTGIFAI